MFLLASLFGADFSLFDIWLFSNVWFRDFHCWSGDLHCLGLFFPGLLTIVSFLSFVLPDIRQMDLEVCDSPPHILFFLEAQQQLRRPGANHPGMKALGTVGSLGSLGLDPWIPVEVSCG